MATFESRDYALINALAEEFADRYRRGDRPAMTDYIDRHPELADQIRELFPAVIEMERVDQVRRADEAPAARPALEQLGDYRIIREVGHGGMGIVYEAEQVSLGRRVALKVLPRQMLRDDRHRRRFEREARSAARLHHTNIVPVFGIGEQNGVHYYVMQFIQGLGLDQVLEELKQMRAGAELKGEASHAAEGGPGASHTGVDAREMARSLTLGRFAQTEIAGADLDGADLAGADLDGTQDWLTATSAAATSSSVTSEATTSAAAPALGGNRDCWPEATPDQPQTVQMESAAGRAASRPDTITMTMPETRPLSESLMAQGISGNAGRRDRKKPNYWHSVAHVGAQVAEALDHAHAQGVLHRDIKPGNLLMDVRGIVWVTDFGLAKAIDQNGLTQTGDIIGTLRYMPPEAFSSRTDPRSDVYALGMTLYELLALKPAFDDDDRQRLIKLVTTGEPLRLERLNPKIPRDLVTIVHKSIDREPRLRYQSARELADDLSRFLADEPIVARRLSLHERTSRWCRRNPVVASLSLLLMLALTGVAVASLLAYFGEVGHRREMEQKNLEISGVLQRERDAKNEALAAKSGARTQLYRSLVGQARGNRMSRRMGQRFESLKVLADARRMATELSLSETQILELRNEAIACLALPDVRVVQSWDGWPSGSFSADVSPSLERYARNDVAGNIHIHRLSDGIELWKLKGIGPGESWSYFSPDGRHVCRLAANQLAANQPAANQPAANQPAANQPAANQLAANQIDVWNVSGAAPAAVLKVKAERLAYSSDGRQLACRDAAGLVRLFDLSSGGPIDKPVSQFETALRTGALAFSPDGRYLALGHRSGIRIRDLETGKSVHELAHPGGVGHLAWSPDGKTVAADGGDKVIHIWSVVSGAETAPLVGHKNHGIDFCFDPAGDILASNDWDGIMRLWNPHTGEQLFHSFNSMYRPRFSADGRLLATFLPRNGKLGIFEMAPLRRFYRTLVRDPTLGRGIYYWPSVSPDGRLLAVGMDNGVGLWDMAGGRPLTFVPGGYSPVVLFEQTGALLVSGPAGVVRWPIEFDAGASETIRIGAAEPLPLPGYSSGISISADGRVVAKAMPYGALVWRRDPPQKGVKMLGPHSDTRCVSVSPDGHWVATGSHNGDKVKIWDARTTKLQRELPLETMNGVYFSPDGRWLVTTSQGARLWSTETWKETFFLGGVQGVAFSADGTLLAIENGDGAVRLINPETGNEYARLEDPNLDRAGRIEFSRDGARLVTTNTDSGSIHVWELHAIRAELAELGLDWGTPPNP